ncbi:MAG: hypothetical protein HBSIN02_05810 [Bacteroidia bacterium]|nr:MAG: hypothetical protein HBSIN02_05810 [Bacteroidia bacterium]
MNCFEVQQYLLDLVDRDIPDDVRAAMLGHFDLCGICRNEYELQLLAKKIIRSHLSRSSTPPHVQSSVLAALAREDQRSSMTRFFSSRGFAPAVVMGLAAVIVLIILNFPRTITHDDFAHDAANDVINRSVQNFSLVRSGELKPSMVACYPDIVVGYFQEQGLDFAVSVPKDDSCDWYGAVVSSYEGSKEAHIVYKRGDDIVYVLEINKKRVQPGSTLSLPPAALQSLTETGWYTDPQHEHCNVVVWTNDETLCAAVSTMNKDRLLALLTSSR